MVSKKLKDRVLETCDTSYDGFSPEQLGSEIRRLLKQKSDHQNTKKDQAKVYNDLIGEAEVKILYCVERVDFLQHEEAVETHLRNTEE